MADIPEHSLPVPLLEKSIQSGSEYGWKQADFLDVIEAARAANLAIEGGLVQYVFEEGTCELYWLHYFTGEWKKGESWTNYCNRTAKEASDMFRKIIAERDIEKEALNSFTLVKEQQAQGTRLDDHKLFIIAFELERDPPVEPKKEKDPRDERRRDNRSGDRNGDRRPQGDRKQGERRPQGDRNQNDRRPQGDRPPGSGQPQGERAPQGNRPPQGERSNNRNRNHRNRNRNDRNDGGNAGGERKENNGSDHNVPQ